MTALAGSDRARRRQRAQFRFKPREEFLAFAAVDVNDNNATFLPGRYPNVRVGPTLPPSPNFGFVARSVFETMAGGRHLFAGLTWEDVVAGARQRRRCLREPLAFMGRRGRMEPRRKPIILPNVIGSDVGALLERHALTPTVGARGRRPGFERGSTCRRISFSGGSSGLETWRRPALRREHGCGVLPSHERSVGLPRRGEFLARAASQAPPPC